MTSYILGGKTAYNNLIKRKMTDSKLQGMHNAKYPCICGLFFEKPCLDEDYCYYQQEMPDVYYKTLSKLTTFQGGRLLGRSGRGQNEKSDVGSGTTGEDTEQRNLPPNDPGRKGSADVVGELPGGEDHNVRGLLRTDRTPDDAERTGPIRVQNTGEGAIRRTTSDTRILHKQQTPKRVVQASRLGNGRTPAPAIRHRVHDEGARGRVVVSATSDGPISDVWDEANNIIDEYEPGRGVPEYAQGTQPYSDASGSDDDDTESDVLNYDNIDAEYNGPRTVNLLYRGTDTVLPGPRLEDPDGFVTFALIRAFPNGGGFQFMARPIIPSGGSESEGETIEEESERSDAMGRAKRQRGARIADGSDDT